MSESTAITACVVCHDEGDRLGPCLASLAWASETIVMDLASGDDSVAVAQRAGARVLHHEPVPIVERVRNEVASAATTDWILVVDPDERVTPGLAAALQEAAADEGVDAVVVPRMNCDFGFEPTHWTQRYEPQLRMYRRSAVAWPTRPNKLPTVAPDRTLRLPGRDELVLRHERSRTIAEVLERSVRYAPVQAQAMLAEGQRFTAGAMLRALGREVRSKLIDSQAWRDGVPGLMRGGVLVGFKFYVWAELWRISGVGRDPDDEPVVRRVGVVSEIARHALGAAAKIAAATRFARRARTRTARRVRTAV
ncbi:MAG TPA: glycosyltransferase [Ilumatobacter sp.]|nr:glycosyltransferase [Ilumatobacter sp.]